jgi:hypothetical protein
MMPRPFEEAQEIGRLLSKDWVAGMSGRPLWMMPFQFRIK